MTYIINHRVNSLNKLNRTPIRFGIEIDVRDYNHEIVLNHEPMANGLNFELRSRIGIVIMYNIDLF